MTMTIQIDKNIPMPVRAVNKPRVEKYSELRLLEVGDSFMVPIGATALANHTRRIGKELGRKFLVRSVIDTNGVVRGSRVWRKA
jgi:hypothetical protein